MVQKGGGYSLDLLYAGANERVVDEAGLNAFDVAVERARSGSARVLLAVAPHLAPLIRPEEL